jgi:hypothetical protein
MAQLQSLASELTSDPLARGYAGMTDEQAAADLNTVYRTWNRLTVPSAELVEAIVYSEYITLTAEQRQFIDLLIIGEVVNINSGNPRTGLLAIFTAGTDTRSNLADLATETISRAAELARLNGFGEREVNAGMVYKARAL